MNNDQQKALEIHNQAREQINSPPLSWSRQLADDSQIWASYLAGNEIGESKGWLRMRGGEINENIATILLATPRDPLTSTSALWHAEQRLWHGKEILPYCEDRCLHGCYTQMIWSKTTHFGMAAASNASTTFVVARYWPAGNIVWERPVEATNDSDDFEEVAVAASRECRHPCS